MKHKENTNKRESSLLEDVSSGSTQGILFGVALALAIGIIGTIGNAIGL